MVCRGPGVQGLTGPIVIRPAGADDLDEVARLWHESASQMDAAASPMPSVAELRARIDAELASGWELYVAERQTQLVGMLALRPAESILDQIFVLPAAQRGGIGGALLGTAKRRLPTGFTLRMAAANRRAERFYERAGLGLRNTGAHPVSGLPVKYFSWNG